MEADFPIKMTPRGIFHNSKWIPYFVQHGPDLDKIRPIFTKSFDLAQINCVNNKIMIPPKIYWFFFQINLGESPKPTFFQGRWGKTHLSGQNPPFRAIVPDFYARPVIWPKTRESYESAVFGFVKNNKTGHRWRQSVSFYLASLDATRGRHFRGICGVNMFIVSPF
jgi:hypothetical protein